jgi:hypothetical protein
MDMLHDAIIPNRELVCFAVKGLASWIEPVLSREELRKMEGDRLEAGLQPTIASPCGSG